MKNVVVIYWSGSGNTQAMAEAVVAGAGAAGAEAKLLAVGSASKDDVLNAAGVALGCPAMGAEVLEESEMEPFIEALEGLDLTGKPLALFGSYDWGDGQWMRDWQERMEGKGLRIVAPGLTIQNTPEEAGLEECRELGKQLAAALG